MQFNKLQLTLILGLYYAGKAGNIASFAKRFNAYFGTSISEQTILFELAKYRNVDPANNQALNTSNLLYKQIWEDYIVSEKISELKELYKRFMRGEFIEQLDILKFNDYVEIEDAIEINTFSDVPIEKPIKTQNERTYRYPRSRDVLYNVLNLAHFSCEAKCDTKLFLRKNGKIFYTEGHHLIPLEYQDDFNFSLDVEANVVSLCPNCHKLLHYGYDKEKILKCLYEARIERLRKCNLDIDFTSLLLMYR